MKMNPVVHFRMPTKDKGRMRKFYETAFGWQTEQLGKEPVPMQSKSEE